MNHKENNIDALIGKYVSGNASPVEINKLEKWMNISSGNRKIVEESLKVWENSHDRISEETKEKDKSDVLHETQKQRSIQLIRTRKQLLIYKIAAIFVIPVTFAITFYFLSQPEEAAKKSQYCIVAAPKGHVAKCILPDGSEVWINTGSTITYNTLSFNEDGREVKLDGEAYFEIVKDKEKAFKVSTAIADINVTGTSFNVKAYEGTDVFETVLAKGSIEMQLNNLTHQVVDLLPGEKAEFHLNNNGISIEKVEPEMFSAWRNGEILFKDATLNDLVKELERIYDINFHLKDKKLGEFRFRGMFSYNNKLIDALEKIKRTANIDYYIENKEVWLFNKK